MGLGSFFLDAYRQWSSDQVSDSKPRMGSEEWLEQEFRNSGLDQSYYQQWMSNPYWDTYRSLDSQNVQGPDPLGLNKFRDTRQIDMENARLDAMKYQSDLLQEFRENRYNSPSMAAARENAAGINASLAGIGDVAKDVGNPEPMFGAPLGSIPSQDVDSNPFLKIVNFGLSLLKGYSSVKGLFLDNSLKYIKGSSDVNDLARGLALDSIKSSDFEIDEETGEFKGLLPPISELEPVDGVDERGNPLKGAIKRADRAEELAFEYFPGSSLSSRLRRKQLATVFREHRSSLITESGSWETFRAMNSARYSPEVLDPASFQSLMMRSLELQEVNQGIDLAFAKWKSELLANPDYKDLWESEQFHQLMASDMAAQSAFQEGQFNEEVYRNLNGDPTAMRNAIDAMKEKFIADKIEQKARQVKAYKDKLNAEIYADYVEYHWNGGKGEYNHGKSKRTAFNAAGKELGASTDNIGSVSSAFSNVLTKALDILF